MSILSLQQVDYQYAGAKKPVLRQVSTDFERGALYGIMGKSGAGKSTLLSLLSGLELPTTGIICHNGQDLEQLDRDRYRSGRIGVIYQGYNLLTNATAFENIEPSLYISGVKIKNKRKAAYMYRVPDEIAYTGKGTDRRTLSVPFSVQFTPAPRRLPQRIDDQKRSNFFGD